LDRAGVARRGGIRDEAAPVVADEVGGLAAERRDQSDRVGREGREVVAGAGFLGLAVAAEVRGGDEEAVGEPGELVPPAVPALREAVEAEDERRVLGAG